MAGKHRRDPQSEEAKKKSRACPSCGGTRNNKGQCTNPQCSDYVAQPDDD